MQRLMFLTFVVYAHLYIFKSNTLHVTQFCLKYTKMIVVENDFAYDITNEITY